jgi:hypothetical protein
MRPLALLAALVGGALLMPTASAGAAPRVLAGFSAHDFEVRPAAISYTGDGTGYLGGTDGSGPRASEYGHLTWVRWGRRTAYATGVDWLNDCDPDCAAGTFSAVPATVRLGAVRHNRYTHMTIRYEYQGRSTTDRRTLRKTGRFYVWAVR